MVEIWSPDTFWLTLTNVALGVVCLALVAVVVVAAVADMRDRRRAKTPTGGRPLRADDRAFQTGDLGVTMADGGERLAPCGKLPRPA